MPEITAVVTAFNLASYLTDCMEELLSQTFRDFNIVVLDDCSADGTADLIRGYINRYPGRVRGIFLTENLGTPGKARNAAMDSGLIDGRYTVFLDGDDHIEPDFLEKLHRAARESGAQIASCAFDRILADTGQRTAPEMRGFPALVELPPQDDILAFLNCSLCTKLIETEVLLRARIPDTRAGEDALFLYRLFPHCRRIALLDDVLFHYRMRSGSAISGVRPEVVFRFADEFNRVRDELSDTGFLDSLYLSVFMHIGLSMPLYACNNRDLNVGALLRRIRAYFREEYGFFRGCRFFSLRSLRRRGVRGLAIWLCRVLYPTPVFTAAVTLYHAVTGVFGLDIRFWMYHMKKLLW